MAETKAGPAATVTLQLRWSLVEGPLFVPDSAVQSFWRETSPDFGDTVLVIARLALAVPETKRLDGECVLQVPACAIDVQ